VSFTCGCGKVGSKSLRALVIDGGGYCKDCERTRSAAKSNATLKDKHVIKKFGPEGLAAATERDSFEVVEYTEPLTKKSNVSFVCSCGKQSSKSFFNILGGGGGFCETCVKIKKVTKHGRNTLDDIEKRDGCVFINYPTPLSTKSIVSFTCQCGERGSKTFCRALSNGGGYCKKCVLINREHKRSATCLEVYGTIAPAQNKEVMEKMKQTFVKNLGVDNPSKLQAVKDKKMDSSLRKYGVENISQAPEVKAAKRATMQERYGVDCPFQHPEVISKCQQTMIDVYGMPNPSQCPQLQDKKRATWLKNYGVFEVMSSKYFRETSEKTCLDKYGVSHVMHVPEIASRVRSSSFSTKLYTFPSGREVVLQGYEPYAIDLLIKQGYDESQIMTSKRDVPEIWYMDSDFVVRRYYMDIHIPKENRVIEVKSTWTVKLNPDVIERKLQACHNAGFVTDTWTFDKKGALVESRRL
jgi:hypothetical protein